MECSGIDIVLILLEGMTKTIKSSVRIVAIQAEIHDNDVDTLATIGSH
jgi:hypothetical protein